MSVLKKLKGTIIKSQQELVNGLRTLASLDTYARHDQLQHIRSKDINLNVGADLLNRYQESWSLIQQQTKECAIKAEKVAAELDPLCASWEEKAKVIVELEDEVRHVPGTVASLKEMQNAIGTLRQEFVIVEKSLDILENLCEELDQKRHLEEEQRKLAQYSALKFAQAEKVKVDLAHKHAKRMSQLETAKQNNLQERAEAFKSAFKDDMEFYKAHGHPDVHKMVTEFPKVTSLSEIEIDQDKKALDSFLGPSEEEGQEEGDADEPYFEDDYTSDYSVKQDNEFIDESDLASPLFEDICENVDAGNEEDTFRTYSEDQERETRAESQEASGKKGPGGSADEEVSGKSKSEETAQENAASSVDGSKAADDTSAKSSTPSS